MGEEKKEEVKKEGESKEEKEEEVVEEIVLRVDMHCEACARKVARALKGFQGVEQVTTDCKASKVVVKGKSADPAKMCQRIQKKSGRKVEIISPLPKPPPPRPPPAQDNKDENKDRPKEDKKFEAPAVITVALSVGMHCEACAQALRRRIHKIKGVESVTTDVSKDRVVVKGEVDPEKLVSDVYKKTGKQASIIKQEKKEEEIKKEGGVGDQVQNKDDDEKVEEKKEELGKGGGEEDNKLQQDDVKYWGSNKDDLDFAYPPQIFSDDNPNACSLM